MLAPRNLDMTQVVHNPDQYMSDLRHTLAQGRKRIGFLIGAGASASVSVPGAPDKPLIPTIAGLTQIALASLSDNHKTLIEKITSDLPPTPNIEAILSRVRALADTIGRGSLYGSNGARFSKLAEAICKSIGELVKPPLPEGDSAFTRLAGWIGGTPRQRPVEIFTTNYDLLFESAFERLRIPYFDGFTGAREPFFDPASVAHDEHPARWGRLWKLHGSLGWGKNGAGNFIRGQGDGANLLIYPTHLKYDQAQKLPYTSFMERLRLFVRSEDSLLLSCGFSYADEHIRTVIDEALSANPSSAVLALHYGKIETANDALRLAESRANLSLYAKDSAVIGCIRAPWRLGDPPHPDWKLVRTTYWGPGAGDAVPGFLLGDFRQLATYVAQTRAYFAEAPSTADPEVDA